MITENGLLMNEIVHWTMVLNEDGIKKNGVLYTKGAWILNNFEIFTKLRCVQS